MPAIDKIIEVISDYTKTTGQLQKDYLHIVKADIARFLGLTDGMCNQMKWQGWSVVGLTTLGATFAVVGAAIPKADAAASVANPRLNANAGLSDVFKTIGDKLKDNDFLKSACQTASQAFNGVSSVPNVWYGSKTTGLQAKADLAKMGFQNAQQERSGFNQETNKAQEKALSILQAKARAN
jgi:hypothetical protein